jgi:uncharacterized RDD family membrane protein YckC
MVVISSIIDIVKLHTKELAEKTNAMTIGNVHVAMAASWPLVIGFFIVYFALLVGLTGQTPGMLVGGLRVVRTDFGRPGFGQVLWRYILAVFLFPIVVLMSAFSRTFVHDRLSGTRVIKTERMLARATAVSS